MVNGIGILVIKLIDSISYIIDSHIESKEKSEKIKSEIEKEIIKYFSQLIVLQKDIVNKESEGSWFQRNWRPITMLVFTFIIFYYTIILPLLSLFGLKIEFVDLSKIPDHVWEILQLGIAGYIGFQGIKTAGNKIKVKKTKQRLEDIKNKYKSQTNIEDVISEM